MGRAASQGEGLASLKSEERRMAPDFVLSDASGKPIKLSELRGDVVLLNFWATWCGPCKVEIPWFKEFQQDYRTQGFAVVGVSLDEDGWEACRSNFHYTRGIHNDGCNGAS
jgi:thiol-disulfide isomerase/thioredoxin